ncbi:unnamed protein product [Tenebrio molitor]|jgi:KRAB domain-containing zinc finger protein|nr:unnamed protein product [Tenebrio molitor]
MFCCDVCGKKYVWSCGLSQHKKYQCGREPQFRCPEPGCTHKTQLKGNMKQHIRNKHKHLSDTFFQ